MGEVDNEEQRAVKPGTAAPDPEAEWWAMTDIAGYLGVKLRTVHAYRLRGKQGLPRGLPAEDAMIGTTPVWHPATIIEWPRPGKGVGGGRPRKS